jgi:hypothetical protein
MGISMFWLVFVIGVIPATVLALVVDKIYSLLKRERQSKLK